MYPTRTFSGEVLDTVSGTINTTRRCLEGTLPSVDGFFASWIGIRSCTLCHLGNRRYARTRRAILYCVDVVSHVVFPSLGETLGNYLVDMCLHVAMWYLCVWDVVPERLPGCHRCCAGNHVVLLCLGNVPGSYLVVGALQGRRKKTSSVVRCRSEVMHCSMTFILVVRFVLCHCAAIPESGGGCKG